MLQTFKRLIPRKKMHADLVLTVKNSYCRDNIGNRLLLITINHNRFVFTQEFSMKQVRQTPLIVFTYLKDIKALPKLKKGHIIRINQQYFRCSDLNLDDDKTN